MRKIKLKVWGEKRILKLRKESKNTLEREKLFPAKSKLFSKKRQR